MTSTRWCPRCRGRWPGPRAGRSGPSGGDEVVKGGKPGGDGVAGEPADPERGQAVNPGGSKPSAEAAFHARIVHLAGAGAVVHVHTVASVAAAARHLHGIEVRDVEMLKGIGRRASEDLVRIPVIGNSQDMAELGDRFEAAWSAGVPAVVVAGHGLYAWGADLLQARHHTEIVEWLLELTLATAQ